MISAFPCCKCRDWILLCRLQSGSGHGEVGILGSILSKPAAICTTESISSWHSAAANAVVLQLPFPVLPQQPPTHGGMGSDGGGEVQAIGAIFKRQVQSGVMQPKWWTFLAKGGCFWMRHGVVVVLQQPFLG